MADVNSITGMSTQEIIGAVSSLGLILAFAYRIITGKEITKSDSTNNEEDLTKETFEKILEPYAKKEDIHNHEKDSRDYYITKEQLESSIELLRAEISSQSRIQENKNKSIEEDIRELRWLVEKFTDAVLQVIKKSMGD